MADETIYRAIMDQMASISSDVRDIRQLQQEYARDNRENAVNLARVLTQIESLNSMSGDFDQLSMDMNDNRLRLNKLEIFRDEFEKSNYETRVKRLEANHLKLIIAVGVIIGVIEIIFDVGKSLL
jgi:hypothetical protein